MARYLLRCRLCGETFESYEDHREHVFLKHPESVWARFRPEIIRRE